MIRKDTTGSKHSDRFVVGKVVAIRDVDPGKGGKKVAKLAVAASPVGWAPIVVRIPFWRPEPTEPGEPTPVPIYGMTYRPHRSYAVVAHRAADGTFRDDSPCGNSARISRQRMWALVRYDRQH